jgi:Zn-dependent protease
MERSMGRLVNPGVVLIQRPVPLAVGRGGLCPPLILAALFALVGLDVGVPVLSAAVLGAVGGTASLVAHELGHVRAARRLSGIRPTRVTLVWLGAATRFEGAYATGREQLRVALAGPLASVAVSFCLAPVLFAPLPRPAKSLLLLLLAMNLALALVNLIPANPLDGHKVAVGVLWLLLGTEAAARRLIGRVGRAWLTVELGAVGVLLLEKPGLATGVAVAAASLVGQKLVVRHSRG